MASEAYEILSLAMRYVFVLLLLLIVARSYLWLLKAHRAHEKEVRRLPDAGLVGELVALDSSRAYPLPREGTVGASRNADIRLKRERVHSLHLMLRFVDGKGVRVETNRGCKALLDGEPIKGTCYALHGSVIEVEGTPLRVRLFAGLNVPHRQPKMQPEDMNTYESFVPEETFLPGEDEAFLPEEVEDDMSMTWAYAPYPPELLRQMQAQQSRTQAEYDTSQEDFLTEDDMPGHGEDEP